MTYIWLVGWLDGRLVGGGGDFLLNDITPLIFEDCCCAAASVASAACIVFPYPPMHRVTVEDGEIGAKWKQRASAS